MMQYMHFFIEIEFYQILVVNKMTFYVYVGSMRNVL